MAGIHPLRTCEFYSRAASPLWRCAPDRVVCALTSCAWPRRSSIGVDVHNREGTRGPSPLVTFLLGLRTHWDPRERNETVSESALPDGLVAFLGAIIGKSPGSYYHPRLGQHAGNNGRTVALRSGTNRSNVGLGHKCVWA